MKEMDLETNAARLLDSVADIIKCYEARWQKTGERTACVERGGYILAVT
jgi:hypothetical protein